MAAIARPIPVLPLVPSMIVPPGLSSPCRSASSIIFTAIRSLMLLPGLNVSILAYTAAGMSRTIPCRRIIGVHPIAPRMESCTLRAWVTLIAVWSGLENQSEAHGYHENNRSATARLEKQSTAERAEIAEVSLERALGALCDLCGPLVFEAV